MRFPTDFLWGAATSAYQIEGAVAEDGRGESIWDRFSHTPGKTFAGQTGDVASDHYHRWAQDVALMAEMGLKAYRFSIAWPRILPSGSGAPDERGVAFYDRLVDALLEHGITPAVTLDHWDLPQRLQDRGGWASRDTLGAFEAYAALMFERLGDRVPIWMTHNEPWVVAVLGYLKGIHAPGHTDLQAALDVTHHLNLSHGLAVRRFRELVPQGQIGIALSLAATYPKSETDADREAAHASDGYTNRWFLDPLLRGRYPDDMVERFAGAGAEPLRAVRDGDMAVVATPIDFLGVNYYFRRLISAGGGEFGWTVQEHGEPGVHTSDIGWEFHPDGLYDLLVGIHREYGSLAMYVTENGTALHDVVGPDGRVRDPRRIDYLRRHLLAAGRALSDGVDLRGYFVWSLLDNFEWAMGYPPRFGLVHVDYETQRRTPKESAAWYSEVIRSGWVPDDA
jgi:beta-glucosidase